MHKYFFFILLTLIIPLQGFEKITYNLRDDPIDIVIPCCGKDVEVLEQCIAGAKNNISNIHRIIVVSPDKYTDNAEWYDERDYPFSKEDVANALGMNKNAGRIGWYFQQLLKFYAPITIPGISSNVLIIDADTVFLRPVQFLNKNNGGMYAFDTRIHKPYFVHMNKLIPGFCRAFSQYSGICHHMMLQRDVIIHLLDTIESQHKTEAWRALCQLVDPQHHNFSGMAEYEIYFNFAFSTTDQVQLRHLKFANISRLSSIPIFRRKGYHFVSCHHYMRQ